MVHKNQGTNILLLIHRGGNSLSAGIRYIVCIQLSTEWPECGLIRQNLGKGLIAVLPLLGPDKLLSQVTVCDLLHKLANYIYFWSSGHQVCDLLCPVQEF